MAKENDNSQNSPLGWRGKTLLLIRHAKSSWDSLTLSDFDRPLNERGKNDAPKMAKGLLKRKVKIDAFISSPAKRAKKTAEYFAKEYGRKEDDIIFVSALYDESIKDFELTIKEIDDRHECVALFSHNPGITAFANQLIKDANIDNMPTCSVFAVKANIDKWKDFSRAKKDYLFFDYPKKDS